MSANGSDLALVGAEHSVARSEAVPIQNPARVRRPDPPRLALRPEEAAAAIGISRELFDREVGPELRSVRIGRLRVFPVPVIEKWLDRHAGVQLGSER